MAAPSSPSARGTLVEIFRLAIPLAFVQVGATSLGVIDTAVIGRTSPAELAAVGLGNSILFAVSILGMGLVLGIEPLVAQAVGAGDEARARLLLRQGIVVALLAFPVTLTLIGLLVLALPAFGVDAVVVPLVRDYVATRALGLLPFLLYWAVKAYLQSLGRTRAPVVGVLLAIVAELILDVMLVFGVPSLGIPALGVIGAGLAHSATSVLRLVVVLIAADQQSAGGGRLLRLRACIVKNDLLRIVRVGLPLGLQLALEVGVFAFAALIMGRLGAADLAAHQVALQCASVTFNLMVGLGSACSVLVGRSIGARDPAGARRAAVLSMMLSLVTMTATGALFLFGGGILARLITPNVDVVQRAAALLMVGAAFQLSDGLQAVSSGALRGAGDTRASFLIHALAHWGVGVPCVLLLAGPLGLGAQGVWWGLTLGLTVAAVLLIARFFRGARRGFAALDSGGHVKDAM